MPGWLVERIVLTYSRPGDLVLAAGLDSEMVLEAAAVADRASYPTGLNPVERCWRSRAALLFLTVAVDGPVARWQACRERLRTGGLLAVITPDATLPDTAAASADASTAGLVCVDHIVAVHAVIDADHLTPLTDRSRPRRPANGTGPGHVAVHSDVYLFSRGAGDADA